MVGPAEVCVAEIITRCAYAQGRVKRLSPSIVSAARCRDDLDSKWRLLLAENELSCVSLLSSISIGN